MGFSLAFKGLNKDSTPFSNNCNVF